MISLSLSKRRSPFTPDERQVAREDPRRRFNMDFAVLEDAQDRNISYIAPHFGGLVRQSGMPALSYADAVRDRQKFAVLNAVFPFGVDPSRFQALKNEIRR